MICKSIGDHINDQNDSLKVWKSKVVWACLAQHIIGNYVGDQVGDDDDPKLFKHIDDHLADQVGDHHEDPKLFNVWKSESCFGLSGQASTHSSRHR